MKIKVCIAAFISYTTGVYVERALTKLGHDVEILDQGQLYLTKADDADLFIGVDSGGPLNIPYRLRSKACMWYIDSRRNINSQFRQPNDLETAKELLDVGGLVFQAQHRDMERFVWYFPDYEDSIYWMPLAADPDVWSDKPLGSRVNGVAFVGNCYDPERHGILHALIDNGIVYWPGIERAVMEDGAAIYRNSYAGLNIPSWLGTQECYDVNMRVFEIMSCGVPLITNKLEDLKLLGLKENVHMLTYSTMLSKERDGGTVNSTVTTIMDLAVRLQADKELINVMGEANRTYILENATYVHRVETMLQHCEEKGMI